jgi:hypothetical protein
VVVNLLKATQQCDTKDNTTTIDSSAHGTFVDSIITSTAIYLSKDITQQPDEKASIISEIPPTLVYPSLIFSKQRS